MAKDRVMKELICSQCGAPLSYKGQVLKCEYCGTLYNEPEETEEYTTIRLYADNELFIEIRE